MNKDKKPEMDNGEIQSGPVLFYNDVVMDHLRNPRNVGVMNHGEADGFAEIGDPACGDVMKLWIKVKSGKITEIKFKTFGCPGAISTSSMLTVLAWGKKIEDAKKLTDDDVVMALEGIPERKKHCSLLGVTALHQAIQVYEQKKNKKRTVSRDHV